MSGRTTKTINARAPSTRDHYDFRHAKRGRFADLAGKHVVVVSDEVWRTFGSDAAVANALRQLVAMVKLLRKKPRRTGKAA